jgi:regulator of replication initiation timing
MRRIALTLMALLAVGCGKSRTDTMKSLAEEQTISAQKDTMLQEVSSNARFIAELTEKLGTVRNLKTARPSSRGDLEHDMTPAQNRALILAQVGEVTERLAQSEQRLEQSRRRVTELTGSDASKSRRLAAFDSVVTSFRTIIETQKNQIADLSAQLQALSDENTALKSDNVRLTTVTNALTTERDSVVAEQNTAYYVAGSEEELIKMGVIEKVGGFLGIGKTQVPARSLSPTAFTPIDIRNVRDIELPGAGRHYRLITRQNVAALTTPPDAKGRFSGTFSIREPNAFWGGTKFMILVAQ